MNCLVFVIEPIRLQLSEQNSDAVTKIEHPITETELRSFVALNNDFRRFVTNFAHLAVPLNKKLTMDEPKTFGCLDGKKSVMVVSLKKAFLSLLVLVIPRAKSQRAPNTDAL